MLRTYSWWLSPEVFKDSPIPGSAEEGRIREMMYSVVVPLLQTAIQS